jgi:hypothetical protein
MSNTVSGIALDTTDAATAERSSFFLVAHTALLALVLVGFAPTFFLRAFFDVPPISASLYVHGAVMAIWFAFGPVQGWLIRGGHIAWHRRVGYIAAAYAAIFVVFGMIANAGLAARLDSPDSPFNIIIWGNYFTLLVFATFVCLAIFLRKRADAHKRLALLASVSIVGPALGRVPTWPVFGAGEAAGRDFAIGGLLVLIFSLIAYDVAVRRRPHPATWIGAFAIFASIAGAVALGLSQAGFDILQNAFHRPRDLSG